MLKTWVLAFTAIVCLSLTASAQIKRTSVPLGNAVGGALQKGSLTGEGARPFHIRMMGSEQQSPQFLTRKPLRSGGRRRQQWRLEVTAKAGKRADRGDGERKEDREG